MRIGIATIALAAILGAIGTLALRLPSRHGADEVLAPLALLDGDAPGPSQPAESDGPPAHSISTASTTSEVREVLHMTRAAGPKDLPVLRDVALHSQDPLVTGNAVKALGRLGAFTGDPDLLALTADVRLRVRQDAVMACGLDGGAAAVPYLEGVLATGEASLRPLVMEALGKIGGPAARELVQRVAADVAASRTDRVFALAALERMRG